MRFEPSISGIPRCRPRTIVDQRRGDRRRERLVILSTAAANREDRGVGRASTPSTSRASRQPGVPRLMSFGIGTHYCPAVPLLSAHDAGGSGARVFVDLPRRAVGRRILTDVPWRVVLGRSPQTLPVTVRLMAAPRRPARQGRSLGAGTLPSTIPRRRSATAARSRCWRRGEGAAVSRRSRMPPPPRRPRLSRRRGANRVHVVVGDVTDDAGVRRRVIDESLGALGGIDGLVCNVGIGEGRGLEGTSVARVGRRCCWVNVRSALPADAALARSRMTEARRDRVRLVGRGIAAGDAQSRRTTRRRRRLAGLWPSTSRFEGSRAGPARTSSRFSGLIDTPLGRRVTQGRPEPARRTPVPLGRQGTAWEVAAPVVFLLSDDAAYITGQGPRRRRRTVDAV